MVEKLLKSLAITSIVSAIIAYFCTHFGIAFLKTFLVAVLIQFIVWYLVGYYADWKAAIKLREIEADMYKEVSKQFADVNCAYCGTVNTVPIKITGDNRVECRKCGKESAVYVELEIAQVTAPLEDTSEKLDEIYNKIKNNEL